MKKIKLKRILFIVFVFGSGLGFSFIYSMFHALPDITVLERETPSIKSLILDRNGNVVGDFFVENRIIVDHDEIPEHVKNAFIAVEDKYFYYHFGIDPTGIIRAAYVNFIKRGPIQGASTITQQLAKNLFLTPEREYIRKIKEIFLAFKLEGRFTKEEIITLYLNQIYFGAGAYGIEAASKRYFGKSVSDISIPEACLLAALPKAPSRYSPFRNKELAVQRRNISLYRMLQENFITQEEYDAFIEEDVIIEQFSQQTGLLSYFIEEIRRYCYRTLGSEMLLRGGLRLYSTMDKDIQKITSRSLRRGLENHDRTRYRYNKIENISESQLPERIMPVLEENYHGVITKVTDRIFVRVADRKGVIIPDSAAWIRHAPLRYFQKGDIVEVRFENLDPKDGLYDLILTRTPIAQGAVMVLDVHSSNILAMAGGYSFRDTEFNRAIQAYRQTGSSIKPLYYSLAIDSGYTQADMINDAPISYYDYSTGEYWQPRNFGGIFHGRITLRTALAKSINVASVKLLREIGADLAIDHLNNLGISAPMRPYLSFALGASDIPLVQMAGALNVFPALGIYREPGFINLITDNRGNIIDERFTVPKRVMRDSIAFVMTDMLKEVVQSGTSQRAKVLNIPVAGKTGTTNNFTDTWFIGFTPDFLIAVWVGNDDKKTLGDERTGASVALPIWIDIVKNMREIGLIEDKDFFVPSNIVFRDICISSGLIAGNQCSEKQRMAFVKGSGPIRICNIHR